MKKLVVIPSDPIHAYEAKGTSGWLKEYYNPTGFFDEVYVLSPIEKIKEEKYGLKIIPVNNDKEYRAKLRNINPVCVRAYGGYWATDYAVFNKLKGIPVVSSVHDTNKELIHRSLKYSDYIISMSYVIKEILLTSNLGKENSIKILGNRVNTDDFTEIKKTDPNIQKIRNQFPNGKMILHVGRKTFQKNIENVITSLKFLPDDFFLVQIGKGNFSEYHEIIIKEGLDKRVFEYQSIENKELRYWYNSADVICIPSRWEGFGVVFIEAGACMSKIVTANLAPMNELLVNDLEMNFLVDKYEDPESISKYILEACTTKLSNSNTRDNIIQKFDKNIIDANEASIYSEMYLRTADFPVSYYFWKFKFYLQKRIYPKYKNIPKRIWRKILSFL